MSEHAGARGPGAAVINTWEVLSPGAQRYYQPRWEPRAEKLTAGRIAELRADGSLSMQLVVAPAAPGDYLVETPTGVYLEKGEWFERSFLCVPGRSEASRIAELERDVRGLLLRERGWDANGAPV